MAKHKPASTCMSSVHLYSGGCHSCVHLYSDCTYSVHHLTLQLTIGRQIENYRLIGLLTICGELKVLQNFNNVTSDDKYVKDSIQYKQITDVF